MAKAYKALSNIEHGEERMGKDADGNDVLVNEVKKFAYGELVTGLSKDVMKNLWDAGVLEQIDVPDAPKAQPESTQTPASGGSTSAPAAGSTATSGTAAATGSGS